MQPLARKRVLALVDGQRCAHEIAKLAFVDVSYVLKIMRKLRLNGHAHIAAWKLTESKPRPIYALFAGEDAPRPTTTSLQRKQRWLANMSADDRDRQRNRHNTRRRKIKLDPLVQQFFGVKK